MTNKIEIENSKDNDLRLSQLHDWLTKVYPSFDFNLIPLTGDASFRRYVRLHFTNLPADSTLDKVYIVMDAPPELESVVEFVAVAELMSPVINVPTIVAKDIEQGFLVLQDFGTTEFAHLLVGASTQKVNDYYQWAIQSLFDLQKIDINIARQSANLPDYSEEKLQQEMALFTDWFLPYIDIDMDDKTKASWHHFTDKLVEQVSIQPQVVVHRDYHSRNLMQDQHNPDSLGIIDFQDAVIGAYTYDLVSLVRDAYVQWDEHQVMQWIEDFWQLRKSADLAVPDTLSEFTQDTMIMGVQRHLKVLGIFVRLAERDGKQRYLADIPKVMQDLIISLRWLQDNGDADVKQWVTPIFEWINNEVLRAYRVKFQCESNI